LLAHALYKAPLFFVAGNVDHGTGTRIIDRLGNLRHAMPWTAAAAMLAGMSMAGIPLSFGFVVKDLIGDAKAAGDVLAFAPLANTVFSAIAVAVAGVAAVRVFWHRAPEPALTGVHEAGPALVLPPMVLAGFGVALMRMKLGLTWLDSGRLLRLSPRTVPSPFHHYLCWKPGAMERWECAAFVDWLRQSLGA
jgi:multicomponent Na+:H+ antiporter subunit A